MRHHHYLRHRACCLALAALTLAGSANAWWDETWGARKEFTIDTTKDGSEITQPIGDNVPVLIRLYQGNFPFSATKEDGSDIRFVAADDKTLLPFHIEKWDWLMNEAFVWVQLPSVEPGTKTAFYLYYNNPDAENAQDSAATYDDSTQLVYHFSENGSPANDATGGKNTAGNAGTPSQGAMIGGGLRLLGGPTAVTIPASDALGFAAGGPLTWSAWIKPTDLQPNAVIYSRRDGENGFVIGLDKGVPYAEITSNGAATRTPAGDPLATGVWRKLAVVADGSALTLFLDGVQYATVSAALPALTTPATLGADPGKPASADFVGEIDELSISKAARPEGYLRLTGVTQSGDNKALIAGADEMRGGGGGHSPILEHLSLFGDIAHNMMFDGWIVIFCCCLMAIVGWTVAIRKFRYLNTIKKGSETFLRQWSHVATDLTILDHTNAESVSSFGGKADVKTQKLLKRSPLYHIYHIGTQEIAHRLQNSRTGFKGLSGRSIQAIRASLDAGLNREVHKLNDGLIFLTISIAGGPYVGLLGTVVGVMITFAVIAKTGEVEVNSIAPGIASALLATVAGLLVAIPALFIYSYLNSRIKEVISAMQMFIDEFVTKMAEFYPQPAESTVPVPEVTASAKSSR